MKHNTPTRAPGDRIITTPENRSVPIADIVHEKNITGANGMVVGIQPITLHPSLNESRLNGIQA